MAKKKECLHETLCRDWPVSALRIICATCGMDVYEIIGDLHDKLLKERRKKKRVEEKP